MMTERIPSLNLMEHPSNSFIEDLEFFLKTDASILNKIFCDIDLHWAIDKQDIIKKLSKDLSLNKGDISTLLGMGAIIFSKLKKGEITLDALNEDFRKLGFNEDDFAKIKDAYETYGRDFVEKNNRRNIYLDRVFEGSNVLEHITTNLNYRVIIDDDNKILDLVPIIRFNIVVKSSKISKEKQEETITFEATEAELKKLIKALDETNTDFLIASEYLKGLRSKK